MTSKRPSKKKKADLSRIECPACKIGFGIDMNYMGIVTCPYCGEYVEG